MTQTSQSKNCKKMGGPVKGEGPTVADSYSHEDLPKTPNRLLACFVEFLRIYSLPWNQSPLGGGGEKGVKGN